MCKELLSKQYEHVGVEVDINKFALHPRNSCDNREDKTRNNNGVGSGNKRMRDQGSNPTRKVINARGMDDRTERGLLVEMIILKRGPLSFLKMTNMCAGELQDMRKFR